MRVIINGVVAGLAEHPRLAYLSQHQWKLDLISSHMIFAVTHSERSSGENNMMRLQKSDRTQSFATIPFSSLQQRAIIYLCDPLAFCGLFALPCKHPAR